MSRTTKHVYEITYVGRPQDVNIEVGGYLVAEDHVRKYCEPERRWSFMDMTTGEGWSIVGRHIGEYEKVKHLLGREGEAPEKEGEDG